MIEDFFLADSCKSTLLYCKNKNSWNLEKSIKGLFNISCSIRKSSFSKPSYNFGTVRTYLATLLLAELSAICELAIHLVSPTTVLVCGRRPTSFTVIIRWRDDFRTLTASSCGMLRKLRPFTSKIWSPTWVGGGEETGVAEGTEQGVEGGAGRDCHMHRLTGQRSKKGNSGWRCWRCIWSIRCVMDEN